MSRKACLIGKRYAFPNLKVVWVSMCHSPHQVWLVNNFIVLYVLLLVQRYFKIFSPWHPTSLHSGSYKCQILIRRKAHLIQQNSHWQVSDGSRVSLWLDDSLGSSPLDNFITLHRIESFVVVNSLIINGHWKVSADLPDPIFHILKALCGTPTLLNAPDKLLWSKNQSPVLTLTAWDLARTRSSPYREQTFEASF